MPKLIINGGKSLFGEVAIGGSKNAALPILFSTIITKGTSIIKNVPDIGDTRVALQLLSNMGALVSREGNTVTVDTRELVYCDPSEELVSKIRASTYLLGASLARFGKAAIGRYGGCNFAKRPIDMHIKAALSLGARLDSDTICVDRLVGSLITFEKCSVGATINAVIMAVVAEGKTVIRSYAKEPHVTALIDFLLSAGADISVTDDEIRINGRELHGGNTTVIGDMIEAGTYLAAGLITDGCVRVTGIEVDTLSSFITVLSELGASIEVSGCSISASRLENPRSVRVVAAPHPEFPTDLQPIIAPLLARFSGGEIFDTVWESRFGYLSELSKFGLDYNLSDCVAIIKPSDFNPANVIAPDLRGGAAVILAALAAKGKSTVSSIETVQRGYENIEEKLRSLGADVYLV